MQVIPSQIKSIDDLRGPAGRLEALLNTSRDDAPYAALVCHPHPSGGGTMHNKVVYHAMKAFSSFGLPVLRFNFRSVGLSEGEHDEGIGEQEDVHAALDWMERNLKLPMLFAGFSFGSNVGLRACCGDSRVKGLIGLGVPVRAEGRDYHYGFLPKCTVPKLTGKSLKVAAKRLKAAHCALGKVTKKEGATPKDGKVTKESQKPGKSLPAGTKIKVTLT